MNSTLNSCILVTVGFNIHIEPIYVLSIFLFNSEVKRGKSFTNPSKAQ